MLGGNVAEKQASGKKLSKKAIVWIVIGAVVLVALISSIAGGGNSSDTASESTTESSESAQSWQVVYTFSGTDNAKSEYFDITDAKTKLTYNIESDPILGVIYMEPDSKVDLNAEGALPVASTGDAGEQSEVVTGKPAGKYWLDVRIPGNWTVTVEQYK
jgi:hypothetical protein